MEHSHWSNELYLSHDDGLVNTVERFHELSLDFNMKWFHLTDFVINWFGVMWTIEIIWVTAEASGLMKLKWGSLIQ